MALYKNGLVNGSLPFGAPFVVSFGMGTNSLAMLVGMHRLGVRPDAILMADVGVLNEHPRTYQLLPHIIAWIKEIQFPDLQFVKYSLQRRAKHAHYESQAGNALANRTLPSIAFFFRKSCSIKWKGDVLDRAVTKIFGENRAAYRAVGFDCSFSDNKRYRKAGKGSAPKSRPFDEFVYPLIEEHKWDREDCYEAVLDAGLPDVGKSSCFFCSSMKRDEVLTLPKPYLRAIIILEANASPNLVKIKGLWNKFTMTDFILESGLLQQEEVDRLWRRWSAPVTPLMRRAHKGVSADDVLIEEAGLKEELQRYSELFLYMKTHRVDIYQKSTSGQMPLF